METQVEVWYHKACAKPVEVMGALQAACPNCGRALEWGAMRPKFLCPNDDGVIVPEMSPD